MFTPFRLLYLYSPKDFCQEYIFFYPSRGYKICIMVVFVPIVKLIITVVSYELFVNDFGL